MKILLAYDGFEYSKHALEEAAKQGVEEASTVTVVGVVPPTARGTKSGGHSDLPPHAEEDMKVATTSSASAALKQRRRFGTAIRRMS